MLPFCVSSFNIITILSIAAMRHGAGLESFLSTHTHTHTRARPQIYPCHPPICPACSTCSQAKESRPAAWFPGTAATAHTLTMNNVVAKFKARPTEIITDTHIGSAEGEGGGPSNKVHISGVWSRREALLYGLQHRL